MGYIGNKFLTHIVKTFHLGIILQNNNNAGKYVFFTSVLSAGFKIENGRKMLFVNGVVWFTNVPHKKRNTPLDLYKVYSPENYPKYDNYDAIEVSKVELLPCDYDGVMGVPVTFLHKYCPEQFKILGHEHDIDGNGTTLKQFEVNGKGTYKRLLIKKVL